jgi:hypothetical protein
MQFRFVGVLPNYFKESIICPHDSILAYTDSSNEIGARCSVVGWGTMLQAGWSRGSIPDELIGFFNWHNLSNCGIALWLNQSLIVINNRKMLPELKTNNLTASSKPIV